jgi:membrane dipeptidase
MWFDAHLDLATLAVLGREMTAPSLASCGGPWQPAAATLTSLAEGQVGAYLGTIFTERGGTDAVGYAMGDDGTAAHAAGLAQLRVYQRWAAMGLLNFGGIGYTVLDGAHSDPAVRAFTAQGTLADAPPARCAILMECADPIREPGELSWWVDRGVVVIGLAWARGSRYAGGNMKLDGASQGGLTTRGRELVRLMDDAGIVHDQAHLSDAATWELFEATDRLVIATHCNCRAIADPSGANERHLTDDTIREIGRRGGVIGLNLFSRFLIADSAKQFEQAKRRATIDEAVAHVEHVCDLLGHRASVGLGSDLDGGLTADDLPEGINAPKDYELLAEGLRDRGWSDEDVGAFMWGNWQRVLGLGVRPMER